MISTPFQRFTAFAFAVAATILVNSCGKDKPSEPSPTPIAVFDEDSTTGDSLAAVECPVYPPNCSRSGGALRLTPTAQGSYLNNCSFFKLEITVRDIAGNPIPGVDVDIEWNTAMYPYYFIPDYQPGVGAFYKDTVFGWRTLRSYTDAFGVARFQVTGGFAMNAPFPSACTLNPRLPNDHGGATIYAGRGYCVHFVTLGRIDIATPDLDGNGIVNGADQSRYLHDQFCQGSQHPSPYYYSRSDFNGDGVINSADLSKLLSLIFYNCPSGW
jgi:hypothetical protein